MQKADSNSLAGASADSCTKDDATFVSSNDAKTNVVGIPDEFKKYYPAIASLKMSNGDEVQIPSSVEAKILNILLNA